MSEDRLTEYEIGTVTDTHTAAVYVCDLLFYQGALLKFYKAASDLSDSEAALTDAERTRLPGIISMARELHRQPRTDIQSYEGHSGRNEIYRPAIGVVTEKSP